jgi:hypothetical protein
MRGALLRLEPGNLRGLLGAREFLIDVVAEAF